DRSSSAGLRANARPPPARDGGAVAAARGVESPPEAAPHPLRPGVGVPAARATAPTAWAAGRCGAPPHEPGDAVARSAAWAACVPALPASAEAVAECPPSVPVRSRERNRCWRADERVSADVVPEGVAGTGPGDVVARAGAVPAHVTAPVGGSPRAMEVRRFGWARVPAVPRTAVRPARSDQHGRARARGAPHHAGAPV